MEAQFWQAKWKKKEIGFHSDSVNGSLERFWRSLGIPSQGRVFVPLCGKTQDMRWLCARGHTVVGAELSEIACTEYFGDHDIPFTRETSGSFTIFESEEARLFCGDIFHLKAKDLGEVTGFWDRAALIALPPHMRETYVKTMTGLLPPQAQGLLVTLSYPQEERSGPPFSVSEEEVHRLYGPSFEIEQLADEDILDEEPKFRQAWGLSAMRRQIYKLRRQA